MDPWAVLGLLPTCEPEVLDAAVRALRLKYHPDKGGGHAPEAFRKIEEAARCCRTGDKMEFVLPDGRALRERLRAIWRTK